MNLINTPVRTASVDGLWKFRAKPKTHSQLKQKCRKQQRARERAFMNRVVLTAYFSEVAEEQRDQRSQAIQEASRAEQNADALSAKKCRLNPGRRFDGQFLTPAANDCFAPPVASNRIEQVIYIGNPAIQGSAERMVIASCAKNRAYA